MKTSRPLVAGLVALLLPVALIGADEGRFAASVEADSLVLRALGSLSVDSASRMEIRGNSTLHPIHMRVEGGRFVLGGSRDLESAKSAFASKRELITAIVAKQLLSKFSLVIPVNSIRPDDKAMETDLLKTLKAGQFPLITYDLEQLTIVSGSGTDRLLVEARGALSIASLRRDTTMELTISLSADGLDIAGKARLLLSDFDLKPPVILGLIRVADPVDISFDLKLRLGSG